MNRRRRFGILAAIGSIALVGSLLSAAGGALAANTRVVDFGSPPITGPSYPANYHLSFTPASSGGVTSVYVLVKNVGNGTLNHVVVQGGTRAPSPLKNPGFIPNGANGTPTICTGTTLASCTPSLPTGFVYVAAFAPAGVTCTITAAGDGIQCDIGQLASQASVTLRLAVRVPSATGRLWLAMSGNEGTSSTGTNQDAFFALGDVTVDNNASDCSTSNFFVSGAFAGFGEPCPDQRTTIDGGTFSQGAFASVNIHSTTECLAGYSCFGKVSEANVEFGVPVPGGLRWTISWLKSSLSGTPKGVIHFLDGYPSGPPPTYQVITFKDTPKCATSGSPTFPCLNAKPGYVKVDGLTYFQAVFSTATNGGNRGF